jgi:hypothetical protein
MGACRIEVPEPRNVPLKNDYKKLYAVAEIPSLLTKFNSDWNQWRRAAEDAEREICDDG